MTRCILFALVLVGCQDVTIGGATQTPTTQPMAARLQISPHGIMRLYDVEAPDGFSLAAPLNVIQAPKAQWELGPIETHIPVASRSGSVANAVFKMSLSFSSFSVTVPVRVRSDDDLQVCRFEVQIPNAALNSSLKLLNPSDVPELDIDGSPTTSLGISTIQQIGSCPINVDSVDQSNNNLKTVLNNYINFAFETSTEQNSSSKPFEVLGVLTQTVALQKVSVFTHRRGGFGVAQRADGVAIDDDGLQATLAVGLLAQRAACAPPVEVNSPTQAMTQPIDAVAITNANADLGLAISKITLQQMAETLTLGGFACRGFEDARRPEENTELFAADDIALDAIDLGYLTVGPYIQVVSAPGSLPTLTLRPQTNDIVLGWEDLVMDVYGEIRGMPVRLLRLVSSGNATLRPQVGGLNQLPLTIDALHVTQATISSEWFISPPSDDVVWPWARRAILLFLADQFVFPLPFATTHALRVRNVTVRADDIVTYLSVEN